MHEQIRNVTFSEPVVDPDNFISEASVDARDRTVVMTWVRHRGHAHTDDGSIFFIRSPDGGRTWDTESITTAMPEHETWGFTMCGVKILSDGSILVFAHANRRYGAENVGPLRSMGSYVARSADGGRTWSSPERIMAWPFRTVATWDNPTELPDGTLLLPVHGAVESGRLHTYRDATRSSLLCSEDSGLSWYYLGTIGFDPAGIHQLMEPGVARMADGRLIALMRQHYEYCNARPPGGYLFVADSDDGGATWSRFRRTGLWGYPADPVVLPDGAAFCVYGYRADPLSIRYAFSADGTTWCAEKSGTLYEPADIPLTDGPTASTINTGYRHIGYPSICLPEDRRVLCAFHSFNADLKQNILLAVFEVDGSG